MLFRSKLDSVKEKKKISFIQKYGVDNPFKSEEIKEKIKIVNLDNYGTDHPMKSDLIKEKVKETCLERYGFENYNMSEVSKEKRKEKIIKGHNKSLIEKSVKMLDIVGSRYKLFCKNCENNFEINRTTFVFRKSHENVPICINCNPIEKNTSYQED